MREAKHNVSEAKHDVVPRPHDVVEATHDVVAASKHDVVAANGRFLVRLSENGHLGNRYAPENFEHMAEKISPRYVEIRGLFGFRCT